MTRMFLRPEFDARRNFIAVRPLLVSGKKVGTGQDFDKSLTTVRRLRQLYDGRWIDFAQGESKKKVTSVKAVEKPAEPAAPKVPQFSKMSDEELRTWLSAAGEVPRRSATRKNLIAQAKRVWDQTKSK